MTKEKLIFVCVSAIFVIGVIWVIFGTHPGEEEASIPDLVETLQGKVYTNPELGFQIQVPDDFTFNEAYVNQTLGPGKEIHGVEFRIPNSLSTGTNLSSDSHMALEKLSGVPCLPSSFLLDARDNSTVTLGQNTFNSASFSGAGAGNFYEETVYTVEKNGSCFALRYFIHSTNIGNYDPGTITEFDRATLLTLFDQIASTLKI